jgi:hypothetical protein
MKKDPEREMRKMAEGEPRPSSPSCSAVPTMTAIMMSAYAVDRMLDSSSCQLDLQARQTVV